jgi:hypothetical protein
VVAVAVVLVAVVLVAVVSGGGDFGVVVLVCWRCRVKGSLLCMELVLALWRITLADGD